MTQGRSKDVGRRGSDDRSRGRVPAAGSLEPSAPAAPHLDDVLASAAHLQALVPDAVLVGGTAAAVHAGHRRSVDHDHVLGDLRDRFDAVLDALETDPEFVLNRLTPGKIILGRLDGIEVGVRQLIRRRPLEVEDHELPGGSTVRVPTLDETLRVKAYLIVKRNQVRDYLDVAALSDVAGVRHAAEVLAHADDYYTDPGQGEASFSSQLVHQLGNPRPRDATQVGGLADYKGLVPKWRDWSAVVEQLQAVAAYMLDADRAVDEEGEGRV